MRRQNGQTVTTSRQRCLQLHGMALRTTQAQQMCWPQQDVRVFVDPHTSVRQKLRQQIPQSS